MTNNKQISRGYKHIIPADWKSLRIEDAIVFSGGNQPPLSTFIYEEREGYVRLIQTRDYRTNKYKTYIKKEDAKKLCTKNDIIIGRYGPPLFQVFRGLSGAYNVALLKAVPNEKLITKEYCYYFLLRPELQNYLEGLSQRSGGQTGVEMDRLYKYALPLPSLPEQQKIAEILSSWDEAISKTQAVIKKLKKRNKGLAQQLLIGRKRLPGFKEEWKMTKLFKVLKFFKKKANTADGYPVFSSSKKGLILQSDYYGGDNRITMREVDEFNLIPSGYVTYRSRSDDGIFTFNVNDFSFQGVVSKYYPVFKCENSYQRFIIALLNFEQHHIGRFALGTSQLVLSENDLKVISFRLPSIEEQQSIANMLDQANNELKGYEQKLATLQIQKKGLMQKLLTGEIRVKTN